MVKVGWACWFQIMVLLSLFYVQMQYSYVSHQEIVAIFGGFSMADYTLHKDRVTLGLQFGET